MQIRSYLLIESIQPRQARPNKTLNREFHELTKFH